MLENRFLTNDYMLKEYTLKVLCKNILIYGSIVTLIGFFVFLNSLQKGHYMQVGLYGGATFICLITTIFSPYVTYKQLKISNFNIHNGKTPETVVIFDDKIYFYEGSFSIDIEYSQIKKLYKLKSCYILMFGKANGIVINPNTFINGTIEDFLILLNERCTNLKL